MNALATRFRFDSFVIDAREKTLWRDGEFVALTPKAFETLLFLVERNNHVVGKDELMRRVWPESFVEENNLSQNISLLRKTIGDHYIKTIPKRGYRFVADVTPLEDDSPNEASASGDTKKEDAANTQARDERAAAQDSIRAAPGPFDFYTPPTIETRYARSGDMNIAYQVVDERRAALDLVFVMGWVSHLEMFWAEPGFARFLRRLASFSRLILFDKRGTGLSDRVPVNRLPTLEERMDDVRAVMDAVGSRRAALCGVSEGGPMCSLFAATYPEKTIALVMIGTYAKRIRSEDYPWAPTVGARAEFYDELWREWGGAVGLEERAPSMADDAAFRRWWATYLRMGASPGAALALTKMNAEIDVRHVLPSIRVPTLVVHRTDDKCLKVEEGRYVAARIPGAKLVELPGADHLPFVGDQDRMLDEIEEFLTGARRHASEDDRTALATVLCVRRAAHEEHDTIERHDEHARRVIETFKGRVARTHATGFLATFDGPARAVRAACAISDAAARLSLEANCGLHTGECEMSADETPGGQAVRVSEKIARTAQSGEILASSTVKDLVAGSGIHFTERGAHRFDKLGEWLLFAIASDTCE